MKLLKDYGREEILGEEVFLEIFEQEDVIRRAQMLLSFQERAKELGVKGQFDTMVKAYEKAEKEAREKRRRNETLIEYWTNFTGKYDSMKCGSWIASDSGIRTFNKDYSNEVVVCYHPILPIGRLRNLETGEEQIRLAYKRNHRWTEITVPKDVISSASKIVTLSKLGVAVTSENARLLVKYLSDVENLNDDEIPVQRSSSKLGWIADSFLPYDTDIIFDGDMQFRQVYESIREHGSGAEWVDYVRELRKSGRLEIKFSLAASFASVLVSRLGALPFIVDFWGQSGGGKTVSMMLAASVWANPDDSMYIGDFKSTEVQLEVRADMLNHLPLMLDDTSKTSSRIRDNFEGVVYDLCSGKGKSRSNKELGIRRENRWKNSILTNGERPLTSYVNQGGAINRIIEIECLEGVYKDPQTTVEFFKKNYGNAGKLFVQAIRSMNLSDLKEMQQELLKGIYSADKTEKQSISMSVLLLADRIATDCIFHDGLYISMDEAREILMSRDEVSEHERCYHYLLDKISMNRQRFDPDGNTEQWGTISEGYAAMYPQAVKELCRQGDFSYKAFLNWADRHGLLLTDGKNQTKPKRIDGKLVRCVFLKLNEFEDENGFEPAEAVQEELPFT